MSRSMKQPSSPLSAPKKQGLYDPAHEHDACGVGFVAHIKNRKSHDIVEKGLEILLRLTHRGAAGADPREGDGAGILLQIPNDFFQEDQHGRHHMAHHASQETVALHQ